MGRGVSVLPAVLFAAVAAAQTSGGGIEGTITDPSAGSVAGAAITIEEVDTGFERVEARHQQHGTV